MDTALNSGFATYVYLGQVTTLTEAQSLHLKMQVTHTVISEGVNSVDTALHSTVGERNISPISRMPHTTHIHIKLPFLWISLRGEHRRRLRP